VNEGYSQGGAGGAALAEAVVAAAEAPSSFDYLYRSDAPIAAKIESIATRVYGADGIFLLKTAKDKIEQWAGTPIENLPICMAKTHLSLSHDAHLANAPTGFTVTVPRPARLHGRRLDRRTLRRHADDARLGSTPAAMNVDIDEEGRTVGLFELGFLRGSEYGVAVAAVAEKAESFGHEVDRSAEPLIRARGVWKIFGRAADKIVGTPDADPPPL